MSLNDYVEIVTALCCNNVYFDAIYAAWVLRIPAERFTDWLDFPEMF